MQLRQQVRARACSDADHQGIMALMQTAKHLWHQQAFHRRQHTDAHLWWRMLFATHTAHALTQRLHAGPGIAHETHPGRGQLDPLLAALEQPGLQQFFQLLEGLGDGRLSDCHGVGGFGKTALAGDFKKAQQMAEFDSGVEVHPRSLSSTCVDCDCFAVHRV
ncbi:hypothetical protein D3C80_1075530 [compost metagenome]